MRASARLLRSATGRAMVHQLNGQAGAVFADKGSACFVEPGHEYAALGILFSQAFQRLMEVALAAPAAVDEAIVPAPVSGA